MWNAGLLVRICVQMRVSRCLGLDVVFPMNVPWFYLHAGIGCFFALSSIVKTGRSLLSMHSALLLASIAYTPSPASSDALQDSEVMSQVERDVLRTHPSLHFFTGDSPDSERHREVGGGEGRVRMVWDQLAVASLLQQMQHNPHTAVLVLRQDRHEQSRFTVMSCPDDCGRSHTNEHLHLAIASLTHPTLEGIDVWPVSHIRHSTCALAPPLPNLSHKLQ